MEPSSYQTHGNPAPDSANYHPVHDPIVSPQSFVSQTPPAPAPSVVPMHHHFGGPDASASPQPAGPAWPPIDPPLPPASGFGVGAPPTSPVPVVRVLSPLGVEYVFLTVCLFTAAGGLTAALLSLVNGQTNFSVLAFPTALLVVSLPVFAALFLRIKQLELRQPELRLDASKRRSTQFTQIVSFLICLFTLVGVVFSMFSKLGGQSSVGIGKALLDGLVLLVVFGGLLAYYWRDEHRGR